MRATRITWSFASRKANLLEEPRIPLSFGGYGTQLRCPCPSPHGSWQRFSRLLSNDGRYRNAGLLRPMHLRFISDAEFGAYVAGRLDERQTIDHIFNHVTPMSEPAPMGYLRSAFQLSVSVPSHLSENAAACESHDAPSITMDRLPGASFSP